jgi:putative DNA primase/helicase
VNGPPPGRTTIANVGYDIVVEPDNLPSVVDAAVELLAARSSGVYERGDVVVGVVDDEALLEAQRPYRVVVLDADSLAQRVNRIARTVRVDGRSGDVRPINFPLQAARTILAERRYCFPRLDAVVESPIVMPDGVVLSRPGFTKYNLLLHFDPAKFPPIEERPNDVEIDAAIGYLLDLLGGFPFSSDVDRSVAIAGLMTAILRAGLDFAPAFLITATAPGTGKTLLSRLFALAATGREAAITSWPDDEVEVRKAILSLLLAAEPVVVFDNVTAVLRSDALSVVLTAPTFAQRLLGGNDVARVPTRATFVCTGNSLQVSGDLVRRSMLCRLDAGVERPETRQFSFDPAARVVEERGDLVHAVLTIVRAYQLSGQKVSASPLAGFSQWCELVRDPLVWAGLPDPVQSQAAALERDPARESLRSMLHAVFDVFCTGVFSAGQLLDAARGHASGVRMTQEQQLALRAAVEEVALRGPDLSSKALGKWLASVDGRVVDGKCFRRVSERTRVGIQWRVDHAA